jgi:hypothetical protein
VSPSLEREKTALRTWRALSPHLATARFYGGYGWGGTVYVPAGAWPASRVRRVLRAKRARVGLSLRLGLRPWVRVLGAAVVDGNRAAAGAAQNDDLAAAFAADDKRLQITVTVFHVKLLNATKYLVSITH